MVLKEGASCCILVQHCTTLYLLRATITVPCGLSTRLLCLFAWHWNAQLQRDGSTSAHGILGLMHVNWETPMYLQVYMFAHGATPTSCVKSMKETGRNPRDNVAACCHL